MRFSFWRAFHESLSAHSIALGFAIGTFVGLTPTFGFQLILGVLLALRFKSSKIAAALAVFITNPVTVIPIYTFELVVGSFLLQGLVNPQVADFHQAIVNLDLHQIKKLGFDTLVAFLFGSLLVSFAGGILVYFIIKPIILRAKEKRSK